MVDQASGWRGELIAIVVMGLLAVAVTATFAWKQSGTQTSETGKIVRFGAYADGAGDHPTVIAIMSDGSERQIEATPALLVGCKVGANIKLLKSPTHVEVAPAGCR